MARNYRKLQALRQVGVGLHIQNPQGEEYIIKAVHRRGYSSYYVWIQHPPNAYQHLRWERLIGWEIVGGERTDHDPNP